ncbi:hypothetical protein RND71_008728 [Anisodus tanguticus]|uniref:Uncharacterized protein n=1 Tax=Anisodus tanguticus TaxID=243964 RepID=A0AAE1VU09_9SOLA|nr:hypothetical protein RND71_008728 [Anisodus tanguticus]
MFKPVLGNLPDFLISIASFLLFFFGLPGLGLTTDSAIVEYADSGQNDILFRGSIKREYVIKYLSFW